MWLGFAVDSFPVFACGAHEFEVELQAQPEAGEGMGEKLKTEKLT